MDNNISLSIPNSTCCLRPGQVVRLGRFSTDSWTVGYGWYSFAGNRPVCGWYLTHSNGIDVKPLQLPDLDDIYFIK